MMTFFIVLQIILLLCMVFHDWIPVPPLNDIPALKQVDSHASRLSGSLINGITVLIPLILTVTAAQQSTLSFSTRLTIFSFYFIFTIGTIISWWTPYFFGSSDEFKQHFRKFANTHHFLPPRGDNVVPNTLHVIMHMQVWLCLGIAIYLLARGFYG